MQNAPVKYRRYIPATDRFLQPAIANFFEESFPKFFGQEIRNNIAEEIMGIFKKLNPSTNRMKPGQIFWNALDKNTRADSPRRKYVPVILTIISEQDIKQLANNTSIKTIRQNAIARICKEALQQGGLLSMRDISLLLLISDSNTSIIRKKYEKEHNEILPHTGNLHDMGSCITHKNQIVYKVIVEKKDPVKVAYETNHSQLAVDRYLKDFHRIYTIYKQSQDIDYIHCVTNISKPVIKQYISLINDYIKEPLEKRQKTSLNTC